MKSKLFFVVFVFFVESAMGILNPVDFLALQSIRNLLDDMPGSNFFSSWDFAGDPCSFSGVFCAGDRVVGLALGDPRAGSPGLYGRLDPAVGDLTGLAELTIVPGRLIGPLPGTVSRLANLRFVGITRNFLSGPIPAGIGSLRRLQTLDLSFNLLSGAVPAGLALIPTLSNLILCHNRLSGNVPSFKSSSLVRLDLSHNDLSGGVPFLPNSIQHLSLSQNRLTGSIDRVIVRLSRLNHLDLSMNLFSGSIPGRLFSFPIRRLFLQRNMFSGVLDLNFEVRISVVDVSYNWLSGAVSPLFGSVRRLYLNNNRFVGKVPGKLVEKVMEGEMEILYLQHNYLTGIEAGPSSSELPRRSSFCLQYNCMLPPAQASSCPVKAGREKTRPANQCSDHRG